MYNCLKFLILPLVLLLNCGVLPAQEQSEFDCFNRRDKFELGPMLGATYYMGDFNPNLTPLKKPMPYGGFMTRLNMAQYFSLRSNIAYAYLSGGAGGMEKNFPPDPWGDNWEFRRPMLFFDVLAEFNFLPYDAVDLHKRQRFTPLLGIGIGAAFLLPDMNARATSMKFNRAAAFFDFPVGVGAKWCVAKRLTLSVEWMFRITFNDNIDFYDGANDEHSPVINNDWIGTFGLSLSYLIKYDRSCPAHERYKPSPHYFKSRFTQSNQ